MDGVNQGETKMPWAGQTVYFLILLMMSAKETYKVQMPNVGEYDT